MYISIWLDCIWWFKKCHGWMCLYTYILRNSGIFLCLYDQVIMSLIFMFHWCHVWMCLYTCILQSGGISVCSYNRDMMSFIFMFGCVCILVLSEVVEYLYACITRLWGHWFLCLKIHVCLCSSKLWNACIRV
jgi:hypothetical protein